MGGHAAREIQIVQLARHWYPLPLYIFLFEELQGLVHAIFPGWLDRWLIAFDFNFAGVHPSVWLAQFASPALNDFMQFAYMTYFLYLVILPAILYAQRDHLAFWTVMVSTAIAHYTVYVIAILFPIESPFYSLASLQTKALAGGWCTATIGLIERFGRVHGAAFPSAHVAGSMVAILASWHYRRWRFWVCLPFFANMCIATVYGRYHYVADVLAGIVVGAMGFVAGASLMQRKGALGRESNLPVSPLTHRLLIRPTRICKLPAFRGLHLLLQSTNPWLKTTNLHDKHHQPRANKSEVPSTHDA